MSARLSQLQQFLAENPNDPFMLFAIAKEYEGLGQDEDALEYYKKLQNVAPDYVGMYYHFGKLLQKIGDAATAIAIFDAGLRVANQQGDRHAAAELAGARLELVDPEEE